MTNYVGTVDYSGQPGSVYVDVLHGVAYRPGGQDSLQNITKVIGSAFNDTILDAGASSQLYGGDGNDTISGGQGNNYIDGGNGNDTVDYSTALFFSYVTVNLATGVATHDISYTDTLVNIENVTGENVGTTIIGDGNDNILQGQFLTGAGGNNTLIGRGTAANSADYSAAPGGISVNLNSGTAAQNGYGGHDTLSNIHTVLGSANDDVIVGSSAGDTLYGGLGHDILVGLAGDDTLVGGDGAANEMQGGTGNDTYVVSAVGDSIIEAPNEGTDTVQTNLASFTLPANVENLTYTGTGNFTGTGNELNNILTGGTGNDLLNGGDGNDQLYGGPGSNILIGGNGVDTVDYSHDAAQWSNAHGGVTVNLATGVATNDFGGTDSLAGIEQVVGTNNADTLTGDSNSNYLIGLGGDDTLDGGTGAANTLQGGTGNDTYIVRAQGDSVIENPSEGYDTVQTTLASYVLPANVEKLAFIGTGNFTGVGNSDANMIVGGTGADYLIGGAGDDTLIGGAGQPNALQGGTGNDTYAVEAVGDSIIEFPGEGHDQVETNIGSFTLPANVEDLFYVGASYFTGTGSVDDNLIRGGNFGNTLNGAAGNDTIFGGTAADLLTGGTGNDVLTGGGGNDTFFFAKGDGLDTVTDFKNGGDHDVIDLTGYGVSSFSQLQAFMSQSAGDTVIAFDAQNHITLSGVAMSSLTAGDFLFH